MNHRMVYIAGALFGIMLSVVGFQFYTWQYWFLFIGALFLAIAFKYS